MMTILSLFDEPVPQVATASVRVLSLWQPWASLMAWGHKGFETRSWPASRAGLRPGMMVAIHAAKRPMTPGERSDWRCILADLGMSADLPYGAVLSLHWLGRCLRTETAQVTDLEERFGDYTPGRFAWEMPLIERLDEPFPLKGAQGVFWAEVPFCPEVPR